MLLPESRTADGGLPASRLPCSEPKRGGMERRPGLRLRLGRLLLPVLALLLLGSPGLVPARAAVLSIDLGSEWVKVAVVNLRPGQAPISVAINEMSKRKSPALVAFSNGERLLAESAAGITARYPERVFSGVRDLVGKDVNQVREALRRNYVPLEVVEDERGAAAFRIHDGSAVYSSEELLAMVLHYAVGLGEAHVKGVIKDAVITVPPYFGQGERRALLSAAQVAGISVLALINEHSGAALQYGIDKDFANESRNVVFYDMGANSVYAAVATFSAYPGKDKGKSTSHNQFQVKGVRWDANLGGTAMEMRLVEYFADEFNKQVGVGVDVRQFPKAMAKLKKQVKRTKEILSANLDAPLSVESLHDDRDFRSSITREKFEKLCGDLWERALVPLKQVLADTGLSVKDVYAVELLGGATRVPKLQAVLSGFLGKSELDRHLDSDEAVVLGAALHAANISDGFKLNRKLGMIDGVPYGIVLKLDNPKGAVFESYDDSGVGADQPLLVGRLVKKVPSKVFRSFKNVKEDFTVHLSYDPSGPLPPGIVSAEFSTFDVSGVAEAYTKYASHNLSAPVKTSLHFSISRSGVLSLDRAETVVEISELYEVPIQNITLDGNQTATPEAAGSESDTVKEEKEGENLKGESSGDQEQAVDSTTDKPQTTTKLRKRTIRIPLKIKDVTTGPGRSLSDEALLKAVERTTELNRKDAETRKTAEAKNSLEAYILETRVKLDEEGIEKVTTEKQLEDFRSDLLEVEDWLYTDGEDAGAAEFEKKLSGLKKTGDAIFFRLGELKARPLAIQYAKVYFTEVQETVERWNKDKPWISETSKEEVLREVKAFEKWLDEKESRQREVQAHQDPAFSSDEVFLRIGTLKDKVAKIDRTPKPKPKVIETVTNETIEPSSDGLNGEQASDNPEPTSVNGDPSAESIEQIESSAAPSAHDEL